MQKKNAHTHTHTRHSCLFFFLVVAFFFFLGREVRLDAFLARRDSMNNSARVIVQALSSTLLRTLIARRCFTNLEELVQTRREGARARVVGGTLLGAALDEKPSSSTETSQRRIFSACPRLANPPSASPGVSCTPKSSSTPSASTSSTSTACAPTSTAPPPSSPPSDTRWVARRCGCR